MRIAAALLEDPDCETYALYCDKLAAIYTQEIEEDYHDGEFHVGQ